jgi:hypothetical protein
MKLRVAVVPCRHVPTRDRYLGVVPAHIPRARAVAALKLAARLLSHEETLLVEEGPEGFNAGMSPEMDETAICPDAWTEWVALSREALE